MGNDFHTTRTVARVFKACRCEQCGRMIERHSSKVVSVGKYDGDFYRYDDHVDCHRAYVAYHTEADSDADCWDFLRDIDWQDEDKAWLVETFPEVAKRLNIEIEKEMA